MNYFLNSQGNVFGVTTLYFFPTRQDPYIMGRENGVWFYVRLINWPELILESVGPNSCWDMYVEKEIWKEVILAKDIC